MSLRSQIRAAHPFIRIRGLLDLHSLLVSPSLIGRASTTAADTNEPEECGSAGEEDCKPGSSEHGQAEPAFDTIVFEDGVK
jgi:hypothetical protein